MSKLIFRHTKIHGSVCVGGGGGSAADIYSLPLSV